MLSCIDEQCSDDPDMGTNICEARKAHDDCKPFGYLRLGPDAIPSSVDCQDSNLTKCCCKSGHFYPQFACSPPVSNFTKGILTLGTFKPLSNNRSRCGAPAPDDHSVLYGDGDGDEGKKKKLVSLSTGWFEKGSRCFKQVEIKGNGKTTVALVVDECDTQNGCNEESAYQPPCPLPNIVSASKAVWTALGVLTCDDDDGSSCSSDPRFGWMDITWSDIIDDVHEDQAASLHLSAASDT
ncbi:hypothetical protein BDL97_11G023200 [Sphagnum fallax]|nr:hypothetical protein BDL97_11G023200 [Sphagnum fallax]